MIVELKQDVTANDREALLQQFSQQNIQCILVQEQARWMIALLSGLNSSVDVASLRTMPGVHHVRPFTQAYKLAGYDLKKERTILNINGQTIGGDVFMVMAGPCAIESEEQIDVTARMVAKAGAGVLRGGAFKPRTSPYDFQGLGERGLQYMSLAAKKHHLLSVSEVMSVHAIDLVASYVDILQIGARNMQNFSLLKEAGRTAKPILLKRGLSATYTDFLMAAEYILQTGNPNVILCERGIRTFEPYARNTLDLAAVPILQSLSHLPVVVDPSHGTGLRNIVPTMAYAAMAAGANGLMVEVHPNPDEALSDAKQTISTETFAKMMGRLRVIGDAVGMMVD